MASGGSYGRTAASSSRSFDFGSDDILCSYDDFSAQESSMGKRSDPPGKNSLENPQRECNITRISILNLIKQDLHDSRIGRPLVSIYEQEDYSREGILSSVDRCMKKYADNLLRSLESISGRLSQLEITCYKLERSLSELRADFIQDQSEKDTKFKSLEKHLQEVHRSVQILRDKQELSETQKELAKLQMAQKESAEKHENAAKSPDNRPDTTNQQLALALPRQTTPASTIPGGTSQPIQQYKEQLPLQNQQPTSSNIQQDQIIINQAGNYYASPQALPRDQHNQPVHSEVQYMQPRPQLQDRSIQTPQQHSPLVNQNQPSFPLYQHQVPPQTEHQQLPQPPPSQAQIKPQPLPSYPPYPSQPVNPGPETYPSSMPMQALNPTIPQPGGIRSEVMAYGYGGAGSSVPQPTSHHNMQQPMQPPGNPSTFVPRPSKGGYMNSAPYLPPPQNVYNAAYNYQPSNLPASRNQQMPSGSSGVHHYDSQVIHNHPYGEMIEKAVGMGFDKNQVINVVQRMVESGQPMNFNSLLDRLNGPAGGASGRAW